MSSKEFDVAVIGGGPGGYVAAIRASQLGFKTTVIEREHLGGICLNWGCIPTKALLRTSELYHTLSNAAEFGLYVDGLQFDLGRIVDRSRKVARRLSGGIGYLMKKNKIDVFEGTGRLRGEGTIEITKQDGTVESVTADHIVVATGARARSLPRLIPDGELIWTYKEAMVPDVMPDSILVVGSGAIGIEFASFYGSLGCDITVVEIMDRVLPVEDEEISALARKAFEKEGMTILTEASVEGLEIKGATVNATIRTGDDAESVVTVDRVILAVGITGNVENVGLEDIGVEVDQGHIVIDEWCQTGVPGVYAIGDVVGPPWLAHKASHEGMLCIEKIAGLNDVHPLNVSNVPGCTYCHPQVASIGLTERAAKEAGHELRVGRFPYQGNGKAIALGEPDGLVKTIFDARTGELLGAHMIGAEVTELIQGFGIAKTLETTEVELMQTIFPHPTLSEMMHESVLNAYGRVIHS